MDRWELKKQAYELHARMCSLMANPKRLEIIDILSEGEKSVEELTQAMGLNKANVSQHLTLMREAHLVTARKEGLHVYYRLANPKIVEAWSLMRKLALEQLTALEGLKEALTEQDRATEVDEMTLAGLVERLNRGDVVLVDVRPHEEYEEGHIEGALSLPLEELDERWRELPPDRELVAYCRGPYCVLSNRAIEKLREHGMAAKKLSGGFPEWEQAGFPVEQGNSP